MATQGLHQVQKQTQTLVLAPQLRQSLKILQAAALDLRATIQEELEMNPTLEELPLDGVSLEERIRESEPEEAGTDDREPDANDGEMEFSEEYEILHKLDEDWRDHFAQESATNVYSSEDAEKRQHFFDSVTSETSLQEHLMRQAELTDHEPPVIEAIEYLVGTLDDRGFLTQSLSDIALAARLPLRTVQEAQRVLKGLEPAGIGSNDLSDCLLTQLQQQGAGNSLAADIIRQHFDLLLRRRIPDIARKLGSTVDEVHHAIEEISRLDPAPGRNFSDDHNRIITPDVTVTKDGDEWTIQLNDEYIPRLRVSNAYKEMIAKGKLNRSEREYIRERMRSGKFLISSIEQRQQTIERITREILRFQRDFFEHGSARLKPLTMNQVAETVGVHETTVSRAIANKFIETPHGVFEFKYFFTPGYEGKNGQAISNTSIKESIARIIEGEGSSKPYSDQDIVNILRERDIKIARRTVAKYRDELGIPPTNLRRQYG